MSNTQTNPEALHEIANDLTKRVGAAFVNPGTPSAPLVKQSDMISATIGGKATTDLRGGFIK